MNETLNSLINDLRNAGLTIGFRDIERLHRVFALDPNIANAARLKSILSAVLIKSTEEKTLFESVFQRWLNRAEQSWQLEQTREPISIPIADTIPTQKPNRWKKLSNTLNRQRWPLTIISTVLIAAMLSAWWFYKPEIVPPPPPPPPPIEDLKPEWQGLTLAEIRTKSFSTLTPKLTNTIPADTDWTGWPWLALALFALLATASLWFWQQRRRWLPEPAPLATGKGPPRVFLPEPVIGPQLLDLREQETLVWGIGRFVTEEPTQKLDLTATINATARSGGITTLHFEQASYQREVWLWLDEAAENETITRLADEVETTLTRHGLAVERATFRGIPERLLSDNGALFAPREIDERRDAALVAILTDGRILTRLYQAADHRVRIAAVLRVLSHWPKLAFVDFSDAANGLQPILQNHELDCIAPSQLANFLGASTEQARPTTTNYDDEAWAAACALAPVSVDETTALTLRSYLGLLVSPWALPTLRTQASAGSTGRLQWSQKDRAAALNWLRDAEAVGEDSLLNRALRFWDERYKKAIADSADTPARQHLQMERGVLQLWRQPAAAIAGLYRLFREPLKLKITQQLQQFAPLGYGTKDHIQLPWRWNECNALEKAMLQEMGFGGGMPTESLERPGRVWLGLGLGSGLLLGLLLKTMTSGWLEPVEPPVIVHTPKPQPLIERISADADNHWQVMLKTPHRSLRETHSARQIEIEWNLEDQICVEKFDDAELWRCGFNTPSARLADQVKHSMVVLNATPDETLHELAATLIAGGSADTVLIDPHWPQHWSALLGEQKSLHPNQQFLLIDAGGNDASDITTMLPAGANRAWLRTDGWANLTQKLNFDGDPQTLASAWPGLVRIDNDLPVRFLLGGGGGCRPVDEIDNASGLTFVRMCPGEFLMGSPDDEEGRWEAEGPQHRVTINEFWISKYETTFEQYDRFAEETKSDLPEDQGWGREQRPVINVRWDDAKAFCEHYGHRLPSEAEWEYAARAGSQERWSFGDDESQLKDYARYGLGFDDGTQPVGKLKANAWGLFDMHGNVWEWVQDCWYNNYDGAPADGSAREGGECSRRALRGGAFYDSAQDLRSADRYRNNPRLRYVDVGFRCVRGSRRQP